MYRKIPSLAHKKFIDTGQNFINQRDPRDLNIIYLTYANHERTRSTYSTNQRNPLNLANSKYGRVNNEDTRTTKLIKTPERRQLHPSGVFIFNFEHTSCLCLVFLLITLTMFLLITLTMFLFSGYILSKIFFLFHA